MEFIFIAVDREGVKQKGALEANDKKEVLEYLRAKNLTTLSLKANNSTTGLFGLFSDIKNGDIILFTRQLASMITAGLTIIESLNILRQESTKPRMQKILDDVISNLAEGNSLSNALLNYPTVFSPTYIALIKSAESGGILDKVLTRLADNLEKSDEIRKKVKSALFYPTIVIVGVVIVVIIMNLFVMPQMGTLYESLDVELPWPTKIVLFLSKATVAILPFSVIAIVLGFIGYRKYSVTQGGRKIIDKIKLKIPIFDQIIKLSILSEVNRTISMLASSGASLIKSINIAADVSGNYYYQAALKNSAVLVEKGAGLTVALQNQIIFPSIMIQMAKVGETTGKIDESLLKVSEYFERDLDVRIRTLTTSIEPFLIVILGIAVAFLIIAVITPIYSLISQIQ